MSETTTTIHETAAGYRYTVPAPVRECDECGSDDTITSAPSDRFGGVSSFECLACGFYDVA
jgi:Zn ribbon nucleic-acid-binding protein